MTQRHAARCFPRKGLRKIVTHLPEKDAYENSSDLITIGTTPGGVIMDPTST
jgi:hypothetical protein